jgi:hypothetical protein
MLRYWGLVSGWNFIKNLLNCWLKINQIRFRIIYFCFYSLLGTDSMNKAYKAHWSHHISLCLIIFSCSWVLWLWYENAFWQRLVTYLSFQWGKQWLVRVFKLWKSFQDWATMGNHIIGLVGFFSFLMLLFECLHFTYSSVMKDYRFWICFHLTITVSTCSM